MVELLESRQLLSIQPPMANPTIVTTASPAATLGTTDLTLTDTAVLANGFNETGTLVFTLTGPGGFSDSKTVIVNGNRTYTASDTLPIAGVVAGTYTWSVNYTGDANNNSTVDQGGPAEQTVISAANPTIVTTASPAATLGTTDLTLTDTAVLANGFNETGTLVFTLMGPDGFSHSQNVAVNGNGTYTASDTLPIAGVVAGTYTWSVNYTGDANNNSTVDQGGPAEQTVISAASPTIVTTASPAATLGTTDLTLTDTAVLANGFNETGTLVFTLMGPDGFSHSQNVAVNGNGTYTASDTLPIAGVVAGTYTWSVNYTGDANNNSTVDQGGLAEQTVISAASPTIVTTASPAATLGTTDLTLTDTAVLANGFNETGTLVFTLMGPDGFSHSQNVAVNGNGTYTASDTLPIAGVVAGTYTWSVNYTGDANNNSTVDQGGLAEQTVISAASPTIVTTASPAATLGTTDLTLTDTAVLANGFNETGTLVFTLMGPDGFSHSQNVAVNGNGTYTASDTLPIAGVVAGTYTWSVNYTGDANNNSTVDQGGLAEQTVISAASPTIVTTASPAATLGTTDLTLTDTAVLANGFNETGTLVFTLMGPDGFSHSQNVAVNGNGTYTASDTLPIAGVVAGTYTWSVSYTGDANNNSTVDQGGPAEQTVISAASPTIVTTASPAVTLGTTAPTLTDTAVLSNGFNETGTLVFTLTGPGGFSRTQSVAVNGNTTYTASFTLPVSGQVAGTYTWSVSYSGDSNNKAAVDQGGTAEQTVVSLASPSVVTTASSKSTQCGTAPTLTDTAVLSNGYYETGTLVFTLTGPGGFSYTQNVAVSGNKTYNASYTLPASGLAAGTYTWSVSYAGDGNNKNAVDQGGAAEQTLIGGVSGTVYVDKNANGTFDTGDTGLGGVTVTLTGTNTLGQAVTATTVTASNGTYSFTGLLAGTYTLTETHPAGYKDETADAGSTGGTQSINKISNFTLPAGVASVNNNFGELTGSLSGRVYVDNNANDTLDTGDTGLGGVTVKLTGTDANNHAVTLTAVTDGTGAYSFTGLLSGTYTLTETHPAGYQDELPNAGTPTGTTSFIQGVSETIASIVLTAGTIGVNENFGELIATAGISGTKYLDVTGNGYSCDDTQMAGVKFSLYADVNHNGVLDSGDGAAVSTATSASDGTFSFRNLLGGTYFLKENIPVGFVQTGPALLPYYTINAASGSQNGGYIFADAEICDGSEINDSKTTYTISGPGITGSKVVTDLRGNTFQGDTVSVTFYVVVPGETLSLVSYTAPGSSFDPNTASQQMIFQAATLTNASVGWHTLTVQLPNCDYQVDFVCCSPIDKFGPAGSNIFYSAQGRLFSADNGGTQLYATSSLSGNIYADANINGVKDNGETVLSGVTVQLTGTDIYGKAVSATTTTNSSGNYVFSNLAASNSLGYTVTVVQPGGYIAGTDTAGNLGGTVGINSVKAILVNTNSVGTNYNFGELRADAQICDGDTATIGFWQGTKGQALIKSLNGSSTSTKLASWLATTFPNLYGASAGNFSMLKNGKPLTNAQVAANYLTYFYGASGAKTNAQVLAAALAVYSTSTALSGTGTTAASCGFNVSTNGIGAHFLNVGSNGAAFGVTNNSVLTVNQMLAYTNSRATNGVLYAKDGVNTATYQGYANSLYNWLNNDGGIS